jgi:hypothetical protein
MNPSPIASVPPHQVWPYTGTTRTAQVMLDAAKGPRGAQNLAFRLAMEDIVRFVQPRDQLSQLAALNYWFSSHHGYLKDPVPTELVKDPLYTLEEIQKKGVFVGDCDDAATFISGGAMALGIKAYPVRVGFNRPTRIIKTRIKPPFVHVLVVARDQYGRAVVIDPVAGAKTYKMLRETTRFG